MALLRSPLRRTLLTGAAGTSLGAITGMPALASDRVAVPRRIRLLVGTAPGGTTDTVARVVGDAMAESLETTVIIENRPGAAGNIAIEQVARADPDGQTLLVTYGSFTINSALYAKLPYDPLKDFAPISLIGKQYSLLVVHPSVPANNVAELIALAKSGKKKLNFAIGGLGTALQMASLQFNMESGTSIEPVSYKGTSPATTDLIAGNVEVMFSSIGNMQGHIRDGRARLLAVASPKRLDRFPDVATVAETFPGFVSEAWFGALAPAGTPRSLIERYNTAIARAIERPAVQRRFETDMITATGSTPDEMQRFIAQEIERWKRVSEASGITPS